MKSSTIDITGLFNAHVEQRKQEEAAEAAAQQAIREKTERRKSEVTQAVVELADAVTHALKPHIGKSLQYHLAPLEEVPYLPDDELEQGYRGFRGEISFSLAHGRVTQSFYQTRFRALYRKDSDQLESVSFLEHGSDFISGEPAEEALLLAIEVYDSYEPDEE